VHIRPAVFEPTFQKHAKHACGGCQIHVLNRDEFRVVTTAVAVLVEMRAQNTGRFQWRQPPYEYELTKLPFDILAGSSELRTSGRIRSCRSRPFPESWMPALERFRAARKPFLLY
jgi:uncharacterized protein YbbC (DUF1343 family)